LKIISGSTATNLSLQLITPKGISYPVVYEIDLEKEKVKKCKMQPSIVLNKKKINTGIDSDRMQVRWAKRDIRRGQWVRFEWK
jgi:hypothetical protein